MLSIRRLAAVYEGESVPVPVSLDVDGGGIVLLVGGNGIGKTSLLNALCGLAGQSIGCALWREVRFDTWSFETRARRLLTRTFQHPRVAGWLEVKTHLRLASPLGRETTPAIPRQGILDACLADAEREVLTSLGGDARAGELSWGQRKLLMTVTAILRRRPLILLDEPLAGLSRDSRAIVVDMLRGVQSAGAIALIATHETEPFDALGPDVVALSRAGPAMGASVTEDG